jgi:hypothetical protein
VAPYFQGGPLFGYVHAYLVLGETLTGRQLAGGTLIVIGALIVSIRFDQGMRLFKARLAALMLPCGLAMALSALIFRYSPSRSNSGPPRSGCSSARRFSAVRCC